MEENEIYKNTSEIVEGHIQDSDERQEQQSDLIREENIKKLQNLKNVDIKRKIIEESEKREPVIIRKGEIYQVAHVGKYYYIEKKDGTILYPGVDKNQVIKYFEELEREILEQELKQQE